MSRGPEKIGRFLGGMIVIALCLLLSSCSSFRLAAVNDDMYPVDYVIPVSNETKIDTIDSYFKLKYKLRTDFNFRWDFAQYAMQQPYSWYWNNPRLDGIWRPYNRFDVYFYSNWFWSDWTWNYPYNNFYGWNHWYRPWGYHNWNYSWYNGPWHNSSYNVVWNSSRRGNNVAYINGPRSSRNSIVNIIDNSNSIENNISRRYNNPRPNNNNNNTVINRIVNTFRENNIKVNFNNKPMINNNGPNYNINNTRPTYNNNNFNSNNSIRNNNSFSTPPPSGNISRGSSTSRGGSSRGGNSRGNN